MPVQERRFIIQHKGFTDTIAPTPYSQQSNNTQEPKNNNAEAGNNKESTTHTTHPNDKENESYLHVIYLHVINK